MDIESKPGTKVKYLGTDDAQVKYGGHDDPRGLLKEGSIYTVKELIVHSFHTEVYLKEFPDKDFNSVCFEEV